ncbi:MAG: cytochrome-c peroxidase [Pseudomonadota bacterium]
MSKAIVTCISMIMAALIGSPAMADTDPDYLAFQQARGTEPAINASADHALAHGRFRPIPMQLEEDIDDRRMRLGFDLFHERSLSRDGTIACNSCHFGMHGGSNGLPVAEGIGGASGELNVPSTFNAVFNFRQFRDGRALDLPEQALGPIENPVEMGHDLDALVVELREDERYAPRFQALYPDGVTAANLADVLAYFQRVGLVRPDSPFLRHLAGDEQALTPRELRGRGLFEAFGCASCHNGINVGGNSYQKLGARVPYYRTERIASSVNDGLFARSGRERDRHVFKVPGLHNVAESGPWFHDGSITTLADAVEAMAEHQLDKQLTADETGYIVAFLKSLTSDFMTGIGRGMRGMGGVGRMDPASEPLTESAAASDNRGFNASHHQDYLAALDIVIDSQQAIVEQMRRILLRQTAHFDFLQYEHLRMIRHARALAHPPAVLSDAERARLRTMADEVLAGAEDLEWVIADFLRAHAVPEANAGDASLFVDTVEDARIAVLAQRVRTDYRRLMVPHTEGVE